MTWNEQSAVIGFWRMGVDDATISAITGIELPTIFKTIKEYKSLLIG